METYVKSLTVDVIKLLIKMKLVKNLTLSAITALALYSCGAPEHLGKPVYTPTPEVIEQQDASVTKKSEPQQSPPMHMPSQKGESYSKQSYKPPKPKKTREPVSVRALAGALFLTAKSQSPGFGDLQDKYSRTAGTTVLDQWTAMAPTLQLEFNERILLHLAAPVNMYRLEAPFSLEQKVREQNYPDRREVEHYDEELWAKFKHIPQLGLGVQFGFSNGYISFTALGQILKEEHSIRQGPTLIETYYTDGGSRRDTYYAYELEEVETRKQWPYKLGLQVQIVGTKGGLAFQVSKGFGSEETFFNETTTYGLSMSFFMNQ